MRAPFVIVIVVVGAIASSAQAASVEQFQIDTKNDLTGKTNGFNVDSCTTNKDLNLILRIKELTQPDYFLRFIQYPVGAPGSPCPTDMLDPLAVVIKDSFEAPPTGGRIDHLESIKTSTFLGPDVCAAGKRDNVNFCFQLTVFQDDTRALLAEGIPVDFDTELPPVPTINRVQPGNTSIAIVVDKPAASGDIFSYVAQFRVCSKTNAGEGEGEGAGAGEGEGEGEGATAGCGASGDFHETTPTTTPTITIGSLKADQEIEFRVLLVDDFGNRGDPTALDTAATAADVGPLDVYDGGGGDLSCSPSCTGSSSTTSTTSSGLGAMLFLLSRRGRRALAWIARTRPTRLAKRGSTLIGMLVVAVGALAAHPARADFGQLTVDMGVSPYKPNIDSEIFNSHKIFPIYACVYGDKILAEVGGDVDTHLWDGFGSLQLSFGFSVSQAQGKAQDVAVLSSGTCGKKTNTDVQLSMAKLRPGITYRFDALLDKWSIPLVPYARLGLVAQGFMFTKGGDFEKDGKTNPVGMRFGWEAAGGMMLALDFLDSIDPFLPDTTRRGRANGAFDHTFVFVEGAWQPVSSFGEPGFVFTPAADTFIGTGVPVLWKVGIAVELL